MDPGPAPKGLQDSALGFNPGYPQNKRFALKGGRCGYQMKLAPIAAQSQNCNVLQLDHRTPASALLGRSIWRPLQGASLLVGDSQG
jgi:hypothetical protein